MISKWSREKFTKKLLREFKKIGIEPLKLPERKPTKDELKLGRQIHKEVETFLKKYHEFQKRSKNTKLRIGDFYATSLT